MFTVEKCELHISLKMRKFLPNIFCTAEKTLYFGGVNNCLCFLFQGVEEDISFAVVASSVKR